jgi:hypothetical protein
MKRFTFKTLGRTLLTLTAVLSLGLWLSGCGGDDNGNPADNGGDATHDGRLICGNGDVWMIGSSCESATRGQIYKSNGVAMQVDRNDGIWSVGVEITWRTDGNKLILYFTSGQRIIVTYEISNGSLTLISDDGSRGTLKKCSGVTIGG